MKVDRLSLGGEPNKCKYKNINVDSPTLDQVVKIIKKEG